jgi:predicted small lipoprotein YifL
MSTRFAAILIFLFLLAACGQKGDLYLRDEAPDAPVTEEAAPDATGQEAAQEADQEADDQDQDDEE